MILLSHEKHVEGVVMLANKKRFIYKAIYPVLLILLLAGCGGGGGDAPPQELVYSGNTNSAVITLENAATLVGNVLYGGDAGTNIPIGVTLTEETNPRSAGAVVQSKLLQIILQSVQDSIFKNNASLPALAIGVVLNEPLECDSGSGSLTGTLNDTTFTGTVTFTYTNCLLEGVTYNGTGTLRIDAFDLNYIEITDATMTFTLMSISSPEFSGSMSGTIRIESMIVSNTEKMTLNYVSRDNLTGKMYKFENMIQTTVYDYIYLPSNKTVTVTGTPARSFDSLHGYVDVDTITPLSFSSVMIDYPDIDGVILFKGAAGSSIRVTVLSGEIIQLELDIDGAPGYEESHILLWEELAVNANTDLTGDDSIQLLRVPLGGGTLTGLNSHSYMGQTFILQEAATAEKLTVYLTTSGIDFRMLLVEIDTIPVPHPTNVIYESSTISLSNAYELTPVTVNFGGIGLIAGQTYAWILDGYVEYDGIYEFAQIAVNSSDSYTDGSLISSFASSSHTSTREENFAGFWYPDMQFDMSFIFEYK